MVEHHGPFPFGLAEPVRLDPSAIGRPVPSIACDVLLGRLRKASLYSGRFFSILAIISLVAIAFASVRLKNGVPRFLTDRRNFMLVSAVQWKVASRSRLAPRNGKIGNFGRLFRGNWESISGSVASQADVDGGRKRFAGDFEAGGPGSLFGVPFLARGLGLRERLSAGSRG